MAKTFRLKLLCARALLTLLLILGVVSAGYTNGPEPPGDKVPERLSGPAAVGSITVSPEADEFNNAIVSVTFQGRCGMDDVALSAPFPSKFGTGGTEPFANFTAANLVDQRFTGGTTQLTNLGVLCYQRAGVSGDLIINTVTRFTNFGASATADVVIMVVVLAG